MLPFAIFALLAIVPLAIAPTMLDTDADPDADDATPDPDLEMPVETPADATFIIGADPTVTGTDGADLFELADDILASDDPIVPVRSIEAGAGDDILALLDPEAATPPEAYAGPTFDDARISGGPGNDSIAVSAPSSDVSGDAGDDHIEVYNAIGASVSGGDGNDRMTVEALSGDPVTVTGGEGNDIIDGRRIDNGEILGGAGDDVVVAGERIQGGAGYVVRADGGAGNDTVVFDSPDAADVVAFEPSFLSGGEDTDVFIVKFDQGSPASEAPADPTLTSTVEIARITDFQSGETLILDPRIASGEDYTIGDLRIETDVDTATSRVIIPYQSDTLPNRDAVILVSGDLLTLNDVEVRSVDVDGLLA